GHAIIRRFHAKYADLLAKSHLVDLNDVVHEVFVSLAKTDFAEVRNIEHYVMRAIKLQCWSLLDKAIRQRALAGEPQRIARLEDADSRADRELPGADTNEPLAELEASELLAKMNLFKASTTPGEAHLLNLLIDETSRSDMAKLLNLNMNTLDTQIRRLRVRLTGYLQVLGYTYKALERFN
ncbi:MAG: hypothetical protein ACRD2L_01525, partial [Terriglobia bacterium]